MIPKQPQNMPVFETAFLVSAPLAVVAKFHRHPQAFKWLSPPLTFTKIDHVEPLAEGSHTAFTIWIGPVPVHWVAVHTHVDMLHGFTDIQEHGPMAYWRHVHAFDAVDARTTRVRETVQYAYPPGWPGVWARLLFNPTSLKFLFAHRARVTQQRTKKLHHR